MELDFEGMGDMTDEELDELVGLGVIGDDIAENIRQRRVAEELRYRAGPEGRQAGRTYVAANPMEHIGEAMQKYTAHKDMRRLDEERKVLGVDQTTGRRTFWDLLRRKKPGMRELGPGPEDSWGGPI